MSELTLEALGYRTDEAAVARRVHDLTHTPEQRVHALRQILSCVRETGDASMMQEQKRHPIGTFPNCRKCGGEPRHIIGRGSSVRETFDVTRPTGTRHQLECRCGERTQWSQDLPDALTEWQRHYAVPGNTAAEIRPLHRARKDAA